MFKNASIYRIVNLPAHFGTGAAELCFGTFEPCGATQEKSVGWVPPRGQANGALLESVAGQWIMALKTETKSVPKEAIDKAVTEQLAHIEATTGRKPGKKETREIKEDARLALLPMAFTKARTTKLWIDPKSQLLVIDSASQRQLDDVITWLVKAVDGIALQLIHTATAPAAAMATWLATKEAPERFTVDRECELKACDETKSVVKYSRHSLDTEEVEGHIRTGKIPTKLAMTFDSRVSFLLTDAGTLKKITFLESVFEGSKDSEGDAFDADVTILAGELQPLITNLIGALGGEMQVAPPSYNNGEKEKPSERLNAMLKRDGLTATVKDNTGTVLATLGHPLDGEADSMYDAAVAIVRKHEKPSISLVQRYLKIGYNRAARLLEQMEKAGVVSPMQSNGQRSILH